MIVALLLEDPQSMTGNGRLLPCWFNQLHACLAELIGELLCQAAFPARLEPSIRLVLSRRNAIGFVGAGRHRPDHAAPLNDGSARVVIDPRSTNKYKIMRMLSP